ncbi:traB domain-containing protein isoform X1 [Calliopsis andreniformis]|uniref:traB domain-containing protein isoform X1 n=1 Tax=Calliopsis andreniformis TaxID=337506 RepID=UPI003FCEB7EB
MDISQSLMSVEDKHYSVVNEKDNYDTKSKSDMQSMTEKLIVNESQINTELVSNPGNQSSAHEASVDTKEKEAEENSVGLNAQSKSIIEDVNVNTSNQNEYDVSIDQRLPETVTLLTTPDGGKLYLVGTAHFSVDSQNDVSMIIQAVQPHTVVVELCKARVGILQLDEKVMYNYAKELTYESIVETLKTYGTHNGLLHILILRMVAKFAKKLGMAPGGEFRRAFEEAKKIPNCIIQLADRPINITIQRAMRSLTWWQTIKLGWNLINFKGHISKEDVEIYKQRDLLDDMISKLKEEYPAIEQVFVKERDLYLAYSLQDACMPHWTLNGIVPARVVGIVGIGHTPGIIANWGKVQPSDIPPIMRVPPQALSTKILKFTVYTTILSAVVYAGYKILPVPSILTLQSIRSSFEGLLKVSGHK